jgi:hypothetical protein
LGKLIEVRKRIQSSTLKRSPQPLPFSATHVLRGPTRSS